MERRICVICFSPAVVLPYSLSLVKWQTMWSNFRSHLPSTIISNTCMNKILANDDVYFCKGCFDSSMELSFVMEEIAKMLDEKSRVLASTLNGILHRRNTSRIFHNPNVNIETKLTERSESSKDTVVVESNANIETIKLEEDPLSTDSPVDVESIVPTFSDSVNEAEITNQENTIVETRPVLLEENGIDAGNTGAAKQSSVKVIALTPNILLNRVRVQIDENNETTYLKEKSGSNILDICKPTSFARDGKVKERKQADNHTTGELPKAASKKSTKNTTGRPNKKQPKKKVRRVFNCQLCNTILKSKRNWEIHITKAHNGQKLSSSKKGRPSTICSPASSKESYECSLCEMKTFSTKINLKRHEKTHETEQNLKCSICKKIFSSTSNLKAHEKNHSENSRNEYKCYLCDKRFYSIERRTTHHDKFHNLRERSYECSVCHKTFDLKNTLMIHKLTHTEGDRKRSFKCAVCDKAYYHKGFLAKHEKVHSKDKL